MKYKFLSPISTGGRSAPELIFRTLSEAIATGDLRPGDKLPPEAELSGAMNVAPMTLRIALGTLRETGLIKTLRGRNGGNFIADDAGAKLMEEAKSVILTQTEIRDLTDWRRAISGEACYLAAERGTPDEAAGLYSASARFDSMIGDLPAMRVSDAKLHTLIAEMSRSYSLVRQETEIQIQMNRLILSRSLGKSYIPLLLKSHEPILAAIAKRDGAKARDEMIAHVEIIFNWSVGVASS